jgi:O-antigen ligase
MLISLTLYFIYPKIENIIFNSIDDIITGKDVALSSRYIYNEFRWDAIKERPMFGYGFIHKDASVTKSVRLIDDNRFAEKFGVIDSGYIDLLIKYGYIGMTLYLILWAKNFIPIILKPSKYRLLQIGMSLYLLQYFLVNYTWSVFSFAHGLVPAFIALYLIKSKYILKKRPVNIKLHNFE